MTHHSPLRYGRLLLLLLALFAASPPAPADEAALLAIRHAVSELVRKEMKSKDIPGLSLALVDDQRVLWAEGFGVADKARGVPARPETLYAAGGLSQLLTATAVLQLADSGNIELDQPVRRYLPDFSIRSRFGNAAAITVRQLLSHHAGLPAMHFRDMWTPRPESLESFVARLRDEYVASPPGQVYSPSFPGYDVLGRMIEVQCGQPFAQCLRERLLLPLGMTHSSFALDHADPRLLAMHYWTEKPVPSQTVRDVPAAGLASSVTELARYVQMLLARGRLDGRQILKARTIDEMFRAQNRQVALDLDNHVGLSWRLAGIHLPQARSLAWLNNSSPFSRGRILLAPEHRLGVVVLTNSSGSTELVEKVSERLMELVLQQRGADTPPVAQTAVTAPSAALRREDVTGHYATMLGLISIRDHERHYRASMLGKNIDLRVQPEGLLAPEYRLLGFIPIPISVLKEARITMTRIAGQRLAVAYYRNHAYRLGEKITPQPLPAAWLRRLGDYQAVERDPLLRLIDLGKVSLAYSDGLLYFRYRVPGWLGLVAKVPVRAVSDHELVVEGSGWLMGDTVRVLPRGRHEVLSYSGYEFRPVAGP